MKEWRLKYTMQKAGNILSVVGMLLVFVSIVLFWGSNNVDVTGEKTLLYIGIFVELIGTILKKPKLEKKKLLGASMTIIFLIGILFAVVTKIQ